jgi:PAS domain S-box-containing protein
LSHSPNTTTAGLGGQAPASSEIVPTTTALPPGTLAQFAAIGDAVPSAILVLDRAGWIRYVNPGFTHLTGVPRDRVLDRDLAVVLPDALTSVHGVLSLRRALELGTAATEEVPWYGTTGRARRMEVRVTPMRTPEGTLSHFVVVGTDLTDRIAEAEASAVSEYERLSLVARYMQQSVMIADTEGRALWVNDAFTHITGFAAAEVMGRSPGDLLVGPATDRNTVQQIAAAVAERRGIQAEILSYRKDGRPVWMSVSYSPVHNAAGAVVQYISVASDITSRKRAELEVGEQRLFLQRVIDSVPSLIFVKDPAGHYVLANKAAATAFDQSPEALRTMTDFDFVLDAGVAKQYRAQDLRVLETHADLVVPEGPLLLPDGSTRWMQVIKRAIFAPGSTQAHVLGVATDITDQKSAQAALHTSEERLRLALEASRDGIWDLDATTGGMWLNDTMHALLGGVAEEPLVDFAFWVRQVHREDLPGVRAAVVAHLKGYTEDFTVDYRLRQGTGGYRWVRARGQVIERNAVGRATRAVGTVTDIEEQKRTETVLRAAKAAAEDANRTKSEFLARMSHELRTPLNSIIGFTNVLRDESRTLRADQTRLYLDRVQKSGTHLLGLINDILDIAKIESGKVEVDITPVDIVALLDDVAQSCEGQAKLKGDGIDVVVLGPRAAAPRMTDARLLKQVLLNLVGNAIKFTDVGSVHLTLEVDPMRHIPVRILVTDTGIGIPSDRLDAIFEAFEQAEGSTTTRRYGGTGLGLAISRDLCAHLGATLTVTSALGRGTTFSINF